MRLRIKGGRTGDDLRLQVVQVSDGNLCVFKHSSGLLSREYQAGCLQGFVVVFIIQSDLL